MVEVTVSVAMSLDGCIDDASDRRLVLSSPEDLAAVHALRARSHAILVGAGTIRKDDPALNVRGIAGACQPAKITVTQSGILYSSRRFFAEGTGAKLVYAPSTLRGALDAKLSAVAEVVALAPGFGLVEVLQDAAGRGFQRILIEGGSHILQQCFSQGLVDCLRLAIAPCVIGDPKAPRFLAPGSYPQNHGQALHLQSVERLGETAVMTYRRDRV